MSVEKQKGKITLMCDVCEDEYHEYNKDDFTLMIDEAKGDGWSVFKNDDHEWTHMCPDCKKVKVE